MSEIDWSKSPEGATHYNSDNDMFYKVEDGEVYHGAHGGGDWHVSAHSVCDFIECSAVIPRPTKQEWEGGLPPVGCECEFIHPGIASYGWQKGTIRAYFDDRVAIKSNPLIWEPHGYALILIDEELKFRPLKSKQERLREELVDMVCGQGFLSKDGNVSWEIADAILSCYNLEPKP